MNHCKAKELVELIKEFLISDYRNAWLNIEGCKIYVRKSKRYINGKIYNFLDLASCEFDEEYRNKGIFKDLLSQLEQMNVNIYLENIFNQYLSEHVKRRVGYTMHIDCHCPSFMRIVVSA